MQLHLEHVAREQTQQRADDLAQQLRDAVGFSDSVSSRLCTQQAFAHVFQVHVRPSAERLYQTSIFADVAELRSRANLLTQLLCSLSNYHVTLSPSTSLMI